MFHVRNWRLLVVSIFICSLYGNARPLNSFKDIINWNKNDKDEEFRRYFDEYLRASSSDDSEDTLPECIIQSDESIDLSIDDESENQNESEVDLVLQFVSPPLVSVQEPLDEVELSSNEGTVIFRDYYASPDENMTVFIHNNNLESYSSISLSVTTFGSNKAQMEINDIYVKKGVMEIKLVNSGEEKLNGNVRIDFMIAY